jgi:hypothetical protein
LLVLIDDLIDKVVLSVGDRARILAVADSAISEWGDTNLAVRDARAVLIKMRGF